MWRLLFSGLTVFLLAAPAGDPMGQFVDGLLAGLGAGSADCPEDLPPPEGAGTVRCVRFDGDFPRFERQMEKQIQRASDRYRVRPNTMWMIVPGGYEREYDIGMKPLRVRFAQAEGIAVFYYETLIPEPLVTRPVESSPGEGEAPIVYVAGKDGVGYPELVQPSKVPLEYPPEARKKGLTDQVYLRIVVRSDGTVGDIEVLRPATNSGMGFEESARRAVSRFRYHPATRNGHPVAVYTVVVIEFQPN